MVRKPAGGAKFPVRLLPAFPLVSISKTSDSADQQMPLFGRPIRRDKGLDFRRSAVLPLLLKSVANVMNLLQSPDR